MSEEQTVNVPTHPVPEDAARPEHAPEEAAPGLDYDARGVMDAKDYDAVIVGAGTRYGTVASQMRNFWDQTGGLWAKGALIGKVGSAFTSTASQHGGQETTLFSIITNLLHHGLTIVGLDYAYEGHTGLDEVNGSTPYGASTIAGGDGSRQPSQIENFHRKS